MDKAGIISQTGFEFQKLVFILRVLAITPRGFCVYEGKDDVEISRTYIPIALIGGSSDDTIIQVKSGEIDKQPIQKYFFHCLLNYDASAKHICFAENKIVVDYNSDFFVEELIEKVRKTTKDNRAIIKKVQTKYASIKTIDDLRRDLSNLVSKTEVVVKNIDKLKEESYLMYKDNYSNGEVSDIILKTRFHELLNIIRAEIAEAILERIPYRISHGELHGIISGIDERISETKYDIEFSEFKSRSSTKVNGILNKNSDSVKQLRMVNNNDEFIISKLVEQIFYEDLRNHYCEIKKTLEIDTLELLAHSNYKDVLLDAQQIADNSSPYKIYSKTISMLLRSRLFAAESSNNKFYSNGCYVYLTDNNARKDRKIKWGIIDEE